MAYGYGYGGYPTGAGYYTPAPPMPDQLAQLRQGNYQNPMMGNPMMSNNMGNQQGMMANNMQPQQPIAPQSNVSAPNSGIIWVSSEREAMEYPIAPNNAVALWDSNNPVIYLKQADASGKPSTEVYDLVKRNLAPIQPTAPAQASQVPTVEYVTRDEFNALEAKFEALTAKENVKVKKPAKETTDD